LGKCWANQQLGRLLHRRALHKPAAKDQTLDCIEPLSAVER
jgi:hypothetical protein